MIKSAYGDDAMDRSSVFELHKLFHEGREKVEDDQRSGRVSTTKNDENMVKVFELPPEYCDFKFRHGVGFCGVDGEPLSHSVATSGH
ncbi:hypothetical protein NQ318_008876 [Aromia moschata]|uniref:Uncharacterized protein n=1 Tax=Aromia moschata TaxID=1265417 RepID=A0AAV8ZCJ4_9CUCU|nr:hypothetical protein NQ318_008876 [Aromia moschata]